MPKDYELHCPLPRRADIPDMFQQNWLVTFVDGFTESCHKVDFLIVSIYNRQSFKYEA